MQYKWKVVPPCREQRLDIRPEDMLPGGVFRVCDVYKSGGGYDKFPSIYKAKTGKGVDPRQFVVQLYGCHLECPYCYVTPNGVWGDYEEYTSEEMVKEFLLAREYTQTDIRTFHLMGGSPGLYIEYWPELIGMLDNYGSFVFHSDLTLTEKRLNRPLLQAISQPNCLYAVNVKGVDRYDYKRNTGKEFDSGMFWLNLYDLWIMDVPFYLTFTNPNPEGYEDFCRRVEETMNESILKHAFTIDLKEYDAVKAYEVTHCGRITGVPLL